MLTKRQVNNNINFLFIILSKFKLLKLILTLNTANVYIFIQTKKQK